MGERAAGPLNVTVRVKPRASKPGVGGRYHEGELVVAVREPAVDGRATAAVTRALADAFAVPVSRVTLVAGATSRTKRFALDGDRDALERRLTELLDGAAGSP
jgi:uncharacterized protein YggU (UPF0235/DUF167 family)